MIGKLKRTLKDKCPVCKKQLQLRVIEHKEFRKGILIVLSEEHIYCSNKNCDYEREVEQKRIRRQEEEIVF